MHKQRQWLFEVPYPPQITQPERAFLDSPHQRRWLFEVLPESVLSEADYMAGKRRVGDEHTSTKGGSKTRTKGKHQQGISRKGVQEGAADQRNDRARREVERKRREYAKALTNLENPTASQVQTLIEQAENDQVQVKRNLETARIRRNYAEVEGLEEERARLEKRIKDLKQLRLSVK